MTAYGTPRTWVIRQLSEHNGGAACWPIEPGLSSAGVHDG